MHYLKHLVFGLDNAEKVMSVRQESLADLGHVLWHLVPLDEVLIESIK